MNSDAPIAVIKGTSLGALRSGRYAMRSSSTATSVDVATDTTSRIASAAYGFALRKPLRRYASAKKNEMNAPDMNTSP